MKLFIALHILLFSQVLQAQSHSVNEIQGVWKMIDMREDSKEPLRYWIIKDDNLLILSYDESKLNDKLYYQEMICGFFSEKLNVYKMDSLNLNSVKREGTFFITISKSSIAKNGYAKKYYVLYDELSLNEGQLEISSTRLVTFQNQYFLPNKIASAFFASKDWNTIEKYFNFSKISKTKAVIYSAPNKSTNKHLVKDDKVEVLEIKENWIRIRYYGTEIIEGWINEKDIR